MTWSMFEAGRTIGEPGPQGGRVLRDEEDARGARLTLEEGARKGPYAITCTIANERLEHVFATDASGTAARVFNAMKSDLDAVMMLLGADQDDADERVAALLGEFARTYR
jgi:hypothetical protein